MNKQIAQSAEAPEIEIPNIGIGTMRTSATVMAVLLQAEGESDRADILADLASRFGISGSDIEERQQSEICSECGMADYLHPHEGCECLSPNA